jgi:hypothetical protein
MGKVIHLIRFKDEDVVWQNQMSAAWQAIEEHVCACSECALIESQRADGTSETRFESKCRRGEELAEALGLVLDADPSRPKENEYQP